MDKADHDVNDVIMHLYPSPTTDAYYAPAVARDKDPPIDPNMVQLESDHRPEHLSEHHSPQEHDRRPIDSTEELRLAAELSSKLGSIMKGNAPSQQEHDVPNSDAVDQNHGSELHSQEGSLDGQDAGVPTHHPALQNQAHGLPSINPANPVRPSQEAQHFMENSPAAAHLGPHGHIGGQVAQHPYFGIDVTPPRKRSKVSRACDECRRKKVKCDAGGDLGTEETCSNCRKSHIQCLFSRVPQKRGPSKGYIKELAERIIFIEGKLGNQGPNQEAVDNVPDGLPRVGADENGKRPFSSISGDANATPPANRLAAWAPEQRTPHQTAPGHPAYGRGRLLAKPSDAEAPEKPAERTEDLPVEAHGAPDREVDEAIFFSYLMLVHPYLPFLPESNVELGEELSKCSAVLRRAFIESLYAVIYSLTAEPALATAGSTKASLGLLTEWETEPGARSTTASLVHLRTLLLLAVEADTHGPGSLKGQQGGPSKTALLARAVIVAHEMGLPQTQLGLTDNAEANIDATGASGLRAWYSLIALDRWNAIGTGERLLIPEDSVVFAVGGLKSLLGEGAYQFLGLSRILGRGARVIQPGRPLASPSALVGSDIVDALLDFWLDHIPQAMTSATHPVVYLAYWHCRIVGYLLNPAAKSTDLLWASRELAQLLSSHHELQTAIHHNLACLAGLILGELTRVDKTREEATAALADFREWRFTFPSWDVLLRARVNEKLRPSTSSGVEATASQSLQHLADLATAAGATKAADKLDPLRSPEDYEQMGFDPRPLLTGGYLNAFRATS